MHQTEHYIDMKLSARLYAPWSTPVNEWMNEWHRCTDTLIPIKYSWTSNVLHREWPCHPHTDYVALYSKPFCIFHVRYFSDVQPTWLSESLRPTRHRIGHFGNVLPSQSFGSVPKKLNPTQQNASNTGNWSTVTVSYHTHTHTQQIMLNHHHHHQNIYYKLSNRNQVSYCTVYTNSLKTKSKPESTCKLNPASVSVRLRHFPLTQTITLTLTEPGRGNCPFPASEPVITAFWPLITSPQVNWTVQWAKF